MIVVMVARNTNKQKYKLEERQTEKPDTDRQKHPEDVCPVVLPSLVQSGLLCWAELCWAAHNAPLSPQWAASQLYNTQQHIMVSKIPWTQLPAPKYCPLLSTHTVTDSGRTARGHKQPVRPERAHRYMVSHTWKHTHTLNLHEDEHTPPY